MGRRNKKLAKLQQAQQAREFLRHKEKPPSFKFLSSEEKRIEIAYTSTIILSNPELQYTKLESIFELCDDPDPSIQALAASSLCSIFIDILPGYRIKNHEEEKIALSKETKAIRIYESDLLKFYSRYIDGLEYLNSFGAINLMCRLLSKLSHFNFRERLLTYLLKHLNEGLDEVIDVIGQVLRSSDLDFKYTTVKAIEQFVKSTSFKIIPERIIEVLSSLKFSRLQNEDGPRKRKRDEDYDYESKKSEDEVLNNQKTLREILSIYFLIIKRHYNTKLLTPALKGLCKYADLLNIELVLDLVKNLVGLLKEDKIKSTNRFHCVFACIRIISSTQHVLKFEDKDLTKILYTSLLLPPSDLQSQRIMIQGLSWLLVEQKQFSFDLVSAFLKRILQVAFHCDLPLARSFLCLTKQVMMKFPKSCSLLEEDESAGQYNVSIPDPYLAEASSSSLLPEIILLKSIQDKQIEALIKSLSNKVPNTQRPLDYLN